MTVPLAQIETKNSKFSCSTVDPEFNLPNLGTLITALDSGSPTSTIGGAFYFENVVSGSEIKSTSN